MKSDAENIVKELTESLKVKQITFDDIAKDPKGKIISMRRDETNGEQRNVIMQAPDGSTYVMKFLPLQVGLKLIAVELI